MSWSNAFTRIQRVLVPTSSTGAASGGIGVVAEADPNTNAAAYADYPAGTIATSTATGVTWFKGAPDGVLTPNWVPISPSLWVNAVLAIDITSLANGGVATFTAPYNLRIADFRTAGTGIANRAFTVQVDPAAGPAATFCTIDLSTTSGAGKTISGQAITTANETIAAGDQLRVTYAQGDSAGASPRLIVFLSSAFAGV